jgi:NADH dehydrogenase
MAGFPAWIAWLLVHVYFLVGFKNRLFVVLQWAWAYLSFRRGARLIVDRDWRDHATADTGPPAPLSRAERASRTSAG